MLIWHNSCKMGKRRDILLHQLLKGKQMDRMTSFTRVLALMVSIVVVSGAFIGCVGGPLTTREKAAGIGALGGAATGAAIGSTVDKPGTGALVGGAIGLGAGALVGDQLQAQERAERRPRRVVVERDRGEEIVIIERDRHGPAYYSREHWTLRELVDDYRYEMASRGWTLREMEIEEKEAEMKFTRGRAKAKIEIEAEEGTFKVKMKRSHDD